MRAYLYACVGTLWVVSAASADLCCLILVINEQLDFPRVGDTQENCNFINKNRNKTWSFLWNQDTTESVVCRILISGFSLVANKHREVSLLHSFYLFKLSGCEGFLFQVLCEFWKKKYTSSETWELSQWNPVLSECVGRGKICNQDGVSGLARHVQTEFSLCHKTGSTKYE